MFTVEERRSVRQALLEKARADSRVVAGAEVGASAEGQGDRWSDLDLTFGLADGTGVADVLRDWTSDLESAFGAVHLFDLPFMSTVYRVFLLPGNLQVDLSFTPRAEFGALGPRFTLLFGEAVTRKFVEPPGPAHMFGMAVHHAVRARICIERGRVWQAEYWISGLRDEALGMACRLRGLEAANGRGYDKLPAELLDAFKDALVRSFEREELMHALRSAIDGLLTVAAERPELAAKTQSHLRQLTNEVA